MLPFQCFIFFAKKCFIVINRNLICFSSPGHTGGLGSLPGGPQGPAGLLCRPGCLVHSAACHLCPPAGSSCSMARLGGGLAGDEGRESPGCLGWSLCFSPRGAFAQAGVLLQRLRFPRLGLLDVSSLCHFRVATARDRVQGFQCFETLTSNSCHPSGSSGRESLMTWISGHHFCLGFLGLQ